MKELWEEFSRYSGIGVRPLSLTEVNRIKRIWRLREYEKEMREKTDHTCKEGLAIGRHLWGMTEKEVTSLKKGNVTVTADFEIVQMLVEGSQKVFSPMAWCNRDQLQMWIAKTHRGYLTDEEVQKVNLTDISIGEILKKAAVSHSAGMNGWQARELKKCSEATRRGWCQHMKVWANRVMNTGTMEEEEGRTIMKFIPKEGGGTHMTDSDQ